MGYFRVDDILLSHWRARVAGPAGIGLWTMGGIYCATQLTDGHIPYVVAETLLPNAKPAVKKVVESGLWLPCEEHERCYLMRAYHADSSGSERQPTRAEVEQRRVTARNRKRDQRRGTAGKYEPVPIEDGERPTDVPLGHTEDTPVRPAAVTPSQSLSLSISPPNGGGAQARPTTKSAETRARSIPASFAITPGMRAWADERVPNLDIDATLEEFVTYWTGTGRAMRDWEATWRNGMLKSDQRGDHRRGKTSTPRPFTPVTWDPEAV